LAHGLDQPDFYSHPDLWIGEMGEYDLPRAFHMDEKALWKPLLSHQFYAGLKITPDAMALMQVLEGRFHPGQIRLLSSPRLEPLCWSGRLCWVRQWMPKYLPRVLLGHDKAAVAHYGALLIDDCDEVVDRWRQSGGWAILYPRPWNSRHEEADRALEVFKADLVKLDIALGYGGYRHAG